MTTRTRSTSRCSRRCRAAPTTTRSALWPLRSSTPPPPSSRPTSSRRAATPVALSLCTRSRSANAAVSGRILRAWTRPWAVAIPAQCGWKPVRLWVSAQHEVKSDVFVIPCRGACCQLTQVKANAAALGERLMSYGYKLVTDGTDNHLVLWDLRKEVSAPPLSIVRQQPIPSVGSPNGAGSCAVLCSVAGS